MVPLAVAFLVADVAEVTGGLSPEDAEALADLCADWPGYAISCDGGNWTATTDQVLMCAGTAETLNQLIARHYGGREFSRFLKLVRVMDES